MKQKIILAILLCFALFPFNVTNAEDERIKVYLNGERMQFENQPVMINGFTMVPMRAIFEALGANVSWNEKSKEITAKNGGVTIKLCIDCTGVTKNGQIIKLEQPPALIDGSTFVPLRFVSESMGQSVKWESDTRSVYIDRNYEPKDLSEIVSPAVVYIETFLNDGTPLATGSGFIVDKDGIVVTNYHVINGAVSATVKLIDGSTYKVINIIGFDANQDLAVLKINGSNLPTVKLGDSNKISNGEKIVAIGSPKGLENSISEGIISNKSRSIDRLKFIQFTAPISAGSSGGALINYNAEIIGITSATRKDSQNINLAIPINEYKILSKDKNLSLKEVYQKEHTITYNDGVYEGEISNGVPNGLGTLTFKDGSKLIGEFKDGTANGKGVYTYSDGSKYTGEFANGTFNGKGKMVSSYGSYEGEFKNGISDGTGKIIYSNGDSYVGQVKNDRLNGYGTYYYANGQTVTGLWIDNNFIR